MKESYLAPLVLPALLALLTQCSDAPPPTARGSAHFYTISPTNPPADTTCLTSYGGIASGTAVPDLPPGVNNLGTAVANGEVSATGAKHEISCTVTGDGSITILGHLEGPNAAPAARNPGTTPASIDISGTIGADGKGTGSVGFYTSGTFDATPFTGTTCALTATPAPLRACSHEYCSDGAEPETYGTLAVSFDCLSVRIGAVSVASHCESHGTVYLDNCQIR